MVTPYWSRADQAFHVALPLALEEPPLVGPPSLALVLQRRSDFYRATAVMPGAPTQTAVRAWVFRPRLSRTSRSYWLSECRRQTALFNNVLWERVFTWSAAAVAPPH